MDAIRTVEGGLRVSVLRIASGTAVAARAAIELASPMRKLGG